MARVNGLTITLSPKGRFPHTPSGTGDRAPGYAPITLADHSSSSFSEWTDQSSDVSSADPLHSLAPGSASLSPWAQGNSRSPRMAGARRVSAPSPEARSPASALAAAFPTQTPPRGRNRDRAASGPAIMTQGAFSPPPEDRERDVVAALRPYRQSCMPTVRESTQDSAGSAEIATPNVVFDVLDSAVQTMPLARGQFVPVQLPELRRPAPAAVQGDAFPPPSAAAAPVLLAPPKLPGLHPRRPSGEASQGGLPSIADAAAAASGSSTGPHEGEVSGVSSPAHAPRRRSVLGAAADFLLGRGAKRQRGRGRDGHP